METNDKKNPSTIVEVVDGGPLKITGQFILKDLKKNIFESPSEVYLCRCGRSGSKPFCDRSHHK